MPPPPRRPTPPHAASPTRTGPPAPSARLPGIRRWPPRTLEAMDVLINVFVGLHIIGIASLLGGFLTQMKAMSAGTARFVPAMLHGALTMLVTGVLLVGFRQMDGDPVNNVKIGVKLALLFVILALVYVKRDEERVDKALFGAVGGLTVINIFIAVLWR